MGRTIASAAPVWLLALIGAILVAALAGDGYLTWLPVVMAFCLLAAFAIQLALGRHPGLVTRLASSAVGAFGVLVVVTGILLLARPDGLAVI